jgi:ribosomal protein S18 acetylase RimI-like enzyme
MKRVFLRPETRGLGIGRILCTELMREAKEDGYSLMRLDTGGRLVEAIKTYESLGFRNCAPYIEYPLDLMPYLVFMEAPL